MATFLTNIAISAWTGTRSNLADSRIASWGSIDAISASTPESWILYRHVLEVLTVSGHTYATADALAQSVCTTAVTTSGGGCNADTWTNPS